MGERGLPLAVVFAAAPVGAQGAMPAGRLTRQDSVELAALRFMRTLLHGAERDRADRDSAGRDPAGRDPALVFDRRMVVGDDPYVRGRPLRDSADAARRADALGASPRDGDRVLVCRGRMPTGCRVRGRGTVLVRLGPTEVHADSAFVTVTKLFGTDSRRQPVARVSWHLLLLRGNDGAWRVVPESANLVGET